MNEPMIALIAVVCNVGAQVSMKYAGRAGSATSGLEAFLSPWLLAALVLYGLSFLLTVRVFAVNPLSVASPVMAGCTFLLITLSSWLVFSEGLGVQKLAGIALIFVGILMLTRS